MSRYLDPKLNDELRDISALGLAHVGDAVFELMVRTRLCINGKSNNKRMHKDAVAFVSAKAQASAAKRLLPELDEKELAVFKRGRNAQVNSVPRSSTVDEYHAATGIEALFGYLYLRGEKDRLDELFSLIAEDD